MGRVATLALASRPRQGLARARAKRECGRVWEWTLTLLSELPFWELESRWTFESWKNDFRGQNQLDLGDPYIIKNLLELKMFEMGSHDPFGHLKHKLWPKEGPRVKLAIWLLTIKSQELTRFPCVQVACNTSLKSSWQRLQLCFRPHPDWRSAYKIIALQNRGSPNFGNFSPGTESHLDVGLVERRKVYCKGEGGGFPQVQAVVSLVSLVSPRSPVACPNTKSALAKH
jgi:hypothetical protein